MSEQHRRERAQRSYELRAEFETKLSELTDIVRALDDLNVGRWRGAIRNRVGTMLDRAGVPFLTGMWHPKNPPAILHTIVPRVLSKPLTELPDERPPRQQLTEEEHEGCLRRMRESGELIEHVE